MELGPKLGLNLEKPDMLYVPKVIKFYMKKEYLC